MDKKPIDLSDNRLKAMSREFSVERGSMDADKRTVELSFASEAPVERFFGNEILECTDKACDLSLSTGTIRNFTVPGNSHMTSECGFPQLLWNCLAHWWEQELLKVQEKS